MSQVAPQGHDPFHQPLQDPGACLGRTCLAWEADGELKAADVTLILERLCQVDVQACRALEDSR